MSHPISNNPSSPNGASPTSIHARQLQGQGDESTATATATSSVMHQSPDQEPNQQQLTSSSIGSPVNTPSSTGPTTPSSSALRLTFEELTELLRCSICHEFFKDASHLARCYHGFCHDCIATWLRIGRSCPICRKEACHEDIRVSSFTRSVLAEARAGAREIQLRAENERLEAEKERLESE